MATDLKLTDAQKPKFKEAMQDFAKKRQDLAQELKGMTPEARREKMTALREEQTKKLKEFLTPEQLDQFQKLMQGQRQGGKKKNASAQQ
jgi:hypothetical protein